MRLSLFLPLLLCFACQDSVQKSQKEAFVITETLARELSTIQQKEQLKFALPHLEVLFDELVELIIEIKLGGTQSDEVLQSDATLYRADQLQAELVRLYKIEGCRELIELAQKKALTRLEQFNEELQKKKLSVNHL